MRLIFKFFSIVLLFVSFSLNASEDLLEINNQDLQKLETQEIKKIFINKITEGYFLNDNVFSDTYFTDGKIETTIDNRDFKGLYKIEDSSICYQYENEIQYECIQIYQNNNINTNDRYFFIFDNKIFGKITSLIDIDEYRKIQEEKRKAKEGRKNRGLQMLQSPLNSQL